MSAQEKNSKSNSAAQAKGARRPVGRKVRPPALTKRDIVLELSGQYDVPQQTMAAIVQSTLDMMTDSLVKGRHIEFRDFGVFEIVIRRPRIGRNPNQPEQTVEIPARRSVRFKPGKQMRERVAAAKR